MKNYYTDMATELNIPTGKMYSAGKNITRQDMEIDELTAKVIGKSAGQFSTIDVKGECNEHEAAVALKKVFIDMCGRVDSCLVIGLGNENMIADSLGAKTSSRIIVSRHMLRELNAAYGADEVSCFCPSVLGVTGIASSDLIRCAVEIAKPKLVVCVDSLAGSRAERLGRCFQVTDTGIAPGSGLGLRHARLDKESLGVPVLAIGVPLVMYARTIIRNCLSEIGADLNNEERLRATEEVGELVVTPKEIDILVDKSAKIISLALNLYLHKNMSEQDINCLMSS